MLAFVVLILALAQTPAAVPVPSADARIARTHTIIERLFSDDLAPIVGQFNDQMRGALSEAQLRQAVTYVVAQTGAFRSQLSTRTQAGPNATGVIVTCLMEKGTIDVVIVFGQADRISGFSMRPTAPDVPYVLPAYATPASYRESEVTVDAGGWPLSATLTMPTGTGPFPAAVLVHGSGPSDRDETFGPNKPFKDLAVGLASRGIAVLRYEKRTRTYGPRIVPLTDFTINHETVDDAVAAVALVRQTVGIDPARVFVIGHSQGAMMAPRIAARAPQIAGLVLLAAPARTLEQSIVDQSRYLAGLDGTVDAAEQSQIDAMVAMAERIRTVQAGDPPVVAMPFRAPASYFVDLRGYSPPDAAKPLPQRMLVLQGERDYQVTMDDFAVWKRTMAGRTNVTFTSYPALNHLFMPGTGPANPTEYMTPSHISPAVIADIGGWIGR